MRTDLNHHAPVAFSAQMQEVIALAERVAATPWNVVLSGPTGAGKGLLAKHIHRRSRADRPWVHLTAGRLVDSLIGSQLQGHTHGAFTGSRGDSKGVFEDASDGTLFLDEVQHLNLLAQVALLEPLGEGTVTRIGAHRPVAVRCRFIFGTGVPLDDLELAGRILPDLRHRLGAIEITVPPLASRRGDILPLADHHLRVMSAELAMALPPHWSPSAIRAVLTHSWPGNVRELGERLRRALLLASDETLEARHLGLTTPTGTDLGRVLDPSERGDVARYALHLTRGTQQDAADFLGISRNTFLRWSSGSAEGPSPAAALTSSGDPGPCTTGIGVRARIRGSGPRRGSGMPSATSS